MIEPVSISSLHENQVIDFGSVVLNDEMIIQFAQQYDPMPFHVDKEAALKSHFKGLIASGPHLFHIFYNREWVPRFKNSVFAGKGINDWMLEMPVYSGTRSHCKCIIKKLDRKPDRGFAVIHWYFEMRDDNDKILQYLTVIVLHYLDK